MPKAVWVPEAGTLPTVQRPLRLAEFDDLFATALLGQQRIAPTRLRWYLEPAVESLARNLTERESSCCSFLTFSFTTGDELRVDVEVPSERVAVLDALAERAAERIRA